MRGENQPGLQFVLVERADQVLSQALNRPLEVPAPRRRGRPSKNEALPDLPPAPKGEGSSRLSQ